ACRRPHGRGRLGERACAGQPTPGANGSMSREMVAGCGCSATRFLFGARKRIVIESPARGGAAALRAADFFGAVEYAVCSRSVDAWRVGWRAGPEPAGPFGLRAESPERQRLPPVRP